MLKDKNGVILNIGDHICIGNKYLVQIDRHIGIGIGIDVRQIHGGRESIDKNCLKQAHQSAGNTSGLIPFYFLNNEIIEKCDPHEKTELCI